MNYVGFYALLSILIFKYFIKPDSIFVKSFIIGLFIPSLLESIHTITYRVVSTSFLLSHSIFFAISIVLIFYIASEIKKNRYYKIASNAFFLGFISHIVLDMFLWIEYLYIFWPIHDMDLKINLISYIFDFNLTNYKTWELSRVFIEFLFLQAYAKIIIEIFIKDCSNGYYLKLLTIFQKMQFNLFFIFLTLFFVFYYMKLENSNFLFLIFNIFYAPSVLLAIILTYKTKANFLNE